MIKSQDNKSTTVRAGAGQRDPHSVVRDLIAQAVAPQQLAATRRFEVHHIRGLNAITHDGEVIFTPEFIYLVDTGLPRIAGVSIPFNVRGLGDPQFPDFAHHRLLTVQQWSSMDIIFPASVGKLLITVDRDMSKDQVREAVAPFSAKVDPVSETSYLAQVTPFYEAERQKQIAAAAKFIRAVELDTIVRIIDGIHWVESRVA